MSESFNAPLSSCIFFEDNAAMGVQIELANQLIMHYFVRRILFYGERGKTGMVIGRRGSVVGHIRFWTTDELQFPQISRTFMLFHVY